MIEADLNLIPGISDYMSPSINIWPDHLPGLLIDISSGATVTLIVDRFTEERLTEGRFTVDRSKADRLTTKSIMNGENNVRTGQLQASLKRTLDRVTVKRRVVNGDRLTADRLTEDG